jgi:hypothetical protein
MAGKPRLPIEAMGSRDDPAKCLLAECVHRRRVRSMARGLQSLSVCGSNRTHCEPASHSGAASRARRKQVSGCNIRGGNLHHRCDDRLTGLGAHPAPGGALHRRQGFAACSGCFSPDLIRRAIWVPPSFHCVPTTHPPIGRQFHGSGSRQSVRARDGLAYGQPTWPNVCDQNLDVTDRSEEAALVFYGLKRVDAECQAVQSNLEGERRLGICPIIREG